MPPKMAEKATAPQKSDEELRLAKELAEKEVAVQTLSEAVKRYLRPAADLPRVSLSKLLGFYKALSANAGLLFSYRHLDNENRLTFGTQELGKQLKACQKDLFDINEFLLNELKVVLPHIPLKVPPAPTMASALEGRTNVASFQGGLLCRCKPWLLQSWNRTSKRRVNRQSKQALITRYGLKQSV